MTTKAEKLRIAGYAAPRLRGGRRRNIKVTDADGNVVREVSDVELAEKVLARAGIELAVDGGKTAEQAAAYAAKVSVTRKRRGGAGRYADTEKVALARKLRAEGKSLRAIAKETGLSKCTVQSYVAPIDRAEAVRLMHERLKSEGRPNVPPRPTKRRDAA